MRYLGLYFAFFCFSFSYVFRADPVAAAIFGSDMLFSYFVFTTAISLSLMFILFLAIKKGFRFVNLSPFFGGLFKGAAGLFFLNLLANRSALLLGAYMLSSASKTLDAYTALIGVVFLVFGYIVFRPFNFDFVGGFGKQRDFGEQRMQQDTNTIDVEVVEDFGKLEKK